MKNEINLKRLVSIFAAIAVVATGIFGLESVFPATTTPAQAVVGSQFDPGNIVSDSNFFDANSMSEAQIQTFLDSKIGTCSNSNCLNVLRVTTQSKSAKYTGAGFLVCDAYAGAINERASTIIYKVQQACGISAKALLVTLQKEQGLVANPAVSSGALERAMGYGCPDNNGGVCAAEYYGFFNQMYWASWQLKRYGTPTVFGTYQPGLNTINWHPNSACGASQVYIQNRATAALYNYTPYRPNDAALGNLYGIGDACSSYGNRNFWVYYNDWFGSPTLPVGSPEGQLEVISTTLGSLYLGGWAFDRDVAASPLLIDVQIDQQWYQMTADKVRPDLAAQYPDVGGNHGFTGSFPFSPGAHTVCVYVKNQGAGVDMSFGCRTIAAADGSPDGVVTGVTSLPNAVQVSGWAVDTDQLNAAVQLDVQVGSQWFVAVANKPSSAAIAKYPSAGENHGFDATLTVPSGVQTICVYARNQGAGNPSSLGCQTITVSSAPPVGELTKVQATPGAIAIAGWTLDPDVATQSLVVDVQVDSQWLRWNANEPVPNGEAAYPGAGLNHGFSGTVPSTDGTHTVCVYVKNAGLGGDLSLGCRVVTVTGSAPTGVIPVGALTTVSGSGGVLALTGWAVDADVPTAPLFIDVQIDAQWLRWTADGSNPAGAAAVAGAGPNHGFTGTVPLAAGPYTVCVYVKGQGLGGDLSLGCRVVTIG